MERQLTYAENAKACRELAKRMSRAHREQLMAMAEQWDRLAEERAKTLRNKDDA